MREIRGGLGLSHRPNVSLPLVVTLCRHCISYPFIQQVKLDPTNMRSYRILGGITIGVGAMIQIVVIWRFWYEGDDLARYDSIILLVASVMVATLIFILGDRLLVALDR